MNSESNNNVSVSKYLILFFLVYLVTNLTASLILELLKVDKVPGLSAIILVVCAAYVAKNFIKREGRSPSKIEQRKLSWGALFMSYCVSASMIAIYAFFLDVSAQIYLDILELLPIWVWLIITILVSAIYWFTLNFIFGAGARRMAGNTD